MTPQGEKGCPRLTRLDHRFTDKDQAYARFTYGGHGRTWDAYSNTVPTLDQVANWEHDNAVNTSAAVNWVHTVSPPFVSEADGSPIPGFDLANHAIVLGQPLDTLYAKQVTLPSIIQFYQNIGVKFETYKQANQPANGANNNWRDWGPHLGAAYRLGEGSRSFIVRGGFSRSYFNDGVWTWMDQSAANTPYTASFSNYMLTDAAQSPDRIGAYGLQSAPTIIAGKNSTNAVTLTNPLGITPGSTYNFFFNQHYPTNYVNDWNVTVEKEILSNTLLRLGYVGDHSGNQGMGYLFNDQMPAYIWYMPQGTPLPTGPLANVARRPYDNTVYGTLEQYMKSGWSNYGGLQFQLERRYSKGFAYQASNPNLNPWRNQYIPGPRQWNLDASIFKQFRIREGINLRFTPGIADRSSGPCRRGIAPRLPR